MEKPAVGSTWKHLSRKVHTVVTVWAVDDTTVAFENVYGRYDYIETLPIKTFLQDYKPWR